MFQKELGICSVPECSIGTVRLLKNILEGTASLSQNGLEQVVRLFENVLEGTVRGTAV